MKKMIQIIIGISLIIVTGCVSKSKKQNSIEMITDAGQQEIVFRNLMAITNNKLSKNVRSDSLAFLVLPVQASCPACRNKTIDSIVKHRNSLAVNHFIIISANGGYKTISGYFLENNKKLPDIENRLFLDSINQAYQLSLYDKKPTMYYTYDKKAYKKVAAVPATVRDDLHEFFSGFRNEKELVRN